MRAQVTLIPPESKRLISKAVVQMEVVRRALKEGIVTIHPSTTTFFIMNEISGEMPIGFLCGAVIPQGMSGAVHSEEYFSAATAQKNIGLFKPWIIRNGKIESLRPAAEGGATLDKILSEMGPKDVYIKSGNALDPQGNVGVFIGSLTGGTIARALGICAGRGVNLILPMGLEKLIPISVFEASEEAGIMRMDYSMGGSVGLFPIGTGTVVTEVKAIEILTGATAIPIGAGGVGGAEGAITLVIKGDEDQVQKSIKIIEGVKGTKLPEIAFHEVVTRRRLK